MLPILIFRINGYWFWRSQDFVFNRFKKMKCMYLCQKAFENFSFCYTFGFWYRKSQFDIFIVSSYFERKKNHFISWNSYIFMTSLSILQAIVCSYLLFYNVNTVHLKNMSYYSANPVGSQILVWKSCSLLSQPPTQGSSFQIYERKHFFL